MNVKFNTGCALLSVHGKRLSVHIGVKPERGCGYKHTRNGEKLVDYERWMWGRYTELYDHNGEYFGLGPLLLACW